MTTTLQRRSGRAAQSAPTSVKHSHPSRSTGPDSAAPRSGDCRTVQAPPSSFKPEHYEAKSPSPAATCAGSEATLCSASPRSGTFFECRRRRSVTSSAVQPQTRGSRVAHAF
jgi:hypothetical protein